MFSLIALQRNKRTPSIKVEGGFLKGPNGSSFVLLKRRADIVKWHQRQFTAFSSARVGWRARQLGKHLGLQGKRRISVERETTSKELVFLENKKEKNCISRHSLETCCVFWDIGIMMNL